MHFFLIPPFPVQLLVNNILLLFSFAMYIIGFNLWDLVFTIYMICTVSLHGDLYYALLNMLCTISSFIEHAFVILLQTVGCILVWRCSVINSLVCFVAF